MSIEASQQQPHGADFDESYSVERAKDRALLQQQLRGTVGVFTRPKDFTILQEKYGLHQGLDYAEYLDLMQLEYERQEDELGACDFVKVTAAAVEAFAESTSAHTIDEAVVDSLADLVAVEEDIWGSDMSLHEWLRFEHILEQLPDGREESEELLALLEFLVTPHHLGDGYRSFVFVHDNTEIDLVSAYVSHEDGIDFQVGSGDILIAAAHLAYLNGGRLYMTAQTVDEENRMMTTTFRLGDGEFRSLDGEMLEMLIRAPGLADILRDAPTGHYHLEVLAAGLETSPSLCVDVDDDGFEGPLGEVSLVNLLIASGATFTIATHAYGRHDTGELDTRHQVVRAWDADLMDVRPLSGGQAFARFATTSNGDLQNLDPAVQYADAWKVQSRD